jgi:enolase-phosphatase E1
LAAAINRVATPRRAASTFAVEAALLDIEGTISPLAYVREVLFPFAAARLAEFVRRRGGDPKVAALLDEARRLAGGADPVAALEAWQRDDVKAPPLKALQGLIWAEGYAQGAFSSPIYPDALEAMRRWRGEGLPLYIYSSGSLQAQELFFEHSAAGDLRRLFAGRFDTTVGAKTDAASYARVAARIGAAPAAILFCSDNAAELVAAEAAELQVAHVVKDGARPDPRWPAVGDFSEIVLYPRR